MILSSPGNHHQKINLATQFYSYAGKSVLRGVFSTHAHTDVARSIFSNL